MEGFMSEVKKFITKPVSTLVEKEQNEDIKKSLIKGAILSGVIAIAVVLVVVATIENLYKVASALSSPEIIAKQKALAYGSANLVGTFFYTLIGAFLATGVIGLLFFAISKLMKSNKVFQNSYALSVNFLIYFAAGILLYSLVNFIIPSVAAIFMGLAALLAEIAVLFAFRRSLGDDVDEDKLTIWTTVITVALSTILALVLGGIITSMILGNAKSGLNSMTDLSNWF